MPAFTQNVYKFNQISSKFLGHMKQNSGLVLVHMHADPIYPTNFTCPYLLLADNYWGGLLIPEITVILSTHFTILLRPISMCLPINAASIRTRSPASAGIANRPLVHE